MFQQTKHMKMLWHWGLGVRVKHCQFYFTIDVLDCKHLRKKCPVGVHNGIDTGKNTHLQCLN